MTTFTDSFTSDTILTTPWSQADARDVTSNGSNAHVVGGSGSANDAGAVIVDPTGQSISATSQRATIIVDGLFQPGSGNSTYVLLWLTNSSFTGFGVEINRGTDGVYDWDVHSIDAGSPSPISGGSFGVASFPEWAQGTEVIVQINSGVFDAWIAGEHVADGLDASGLGSLVNCLLGLFPRSINTTTVQATAVQSFSITDEIAGAVEDIIETGAASEAAALASAGTLVASTLVAQTFTGVAAEAVAPAEVGTLVAGMLVTQALDGATSESGSISELGVTAITSPAIRVDEVLRDTDTGELIALGSTEVLVLGGSSGSRTIVSENSAYEIVDGVVEIAGPYTINDSYFVAILESSDRMSILPATVIDRNA
jgi:hypothetical protein